MLKQAALYTLSTANRFGSGGRIRRTIGGGERTRLNLGCQTNRIEGWLNVDIVTFPGAYYMDATKPWPMRDGTLDAILCEHMIEHVSKAAGVALIREAFRALKPGAPIRLVTPCLDTFARMCLEPEGREAKIYVDFVKSRDAGSTVCDAANQIFYGYGHRYIYSPGELERLLREAGFVDVVHTEAGETQNPEFLGKEGHPGLVGFDVNAVEAFGIEAVKPG